MTTQHLTAYPADINTAGALLRDGHLVAIPTETVYGLAANIFNNEAVASIYKAKGRPSDNPLIVHIADIADVNALWRVIPDSAYKLMQAFWPGPLTIVLPKTDAVSHVVSGNLDTVAVRMPAHPVALEIIRKAGVPLAAPSANLSGGPSPTTAARVHADLDGRIAAVLDGGDCEVGVESTVVSLCNKVPCLLRPGGVTLFELQDLLGEVTVADAVLHPLKNGEQAASPGMKYQHYSPNATVILVKGNAAAFAQYVNEQNGDHRMAMCFDGEETALHVPYVTYGARNDDAAQARRLFEALRVADDLGAHTLYVACPREDGIGLAVYNRLLRSAGFQVVTL